jgi:transcriptional regulator with XRE-family HTH domain
VAGEPREGQAPRHKPWGSPGKAAQGHGEKIIDQLTSDYQLAKFLGVRQQTVSNYRNRKSGLDETMALKIADALGVDPAHVLTCVAAERAKDAAVKKAWQRAAAATAAAVLIALALPDPGAQLDALTISSAEASPLALYIMLNVVAVLAAIVAALAVGLFLTDNTARPGPHSTPL